jgi:UDP-N-acetylglucosamine diphosphorylase/glucosamine-1-phosphate N-acetyltransferase
MSKTAIILAAGKGTRMQSDLPKVLHPVADRPMVEWVMDACRHAGCDRLILVVGHKKEVVQQAVAERSADVTWVTQQPQLGTGHAVMVCRQQLEDLEGPVLVVAGDGPLIRPETLEELMDTHQAASAAVTLATSILPEPGAYGRIVRDADDNLVGIVEYLEASDTQKQIREVNVSIYCFDAAALRGVLGKLNNNNAKGEYYITDALGLLRDEGKKLAAVAAVPPEDTKSINTLEELAEVDQIMRDRLAEAGSAQ